MNNVELEIGTRKGTAASGPPSHSHRQVLTRQEPCEALTASPCSAAGALVTHEGPAILQHQRHSSQPAPLKRIEGEIGSSTLFFIYFPNPHLKMCFY